MLLGYVQTKLFPSGEKELEFEFPYKKYVEVSWTSDEAYLVCYGCEKQKYHLYVHSAKSGKLVHKFHVKYDGFKVKGFFFWLREELKESQSPLKMLLFFILLAQNHFLKLSLIEQTEPRINFVLLLSSPGPNPGPNRPPSRIKVK